MTGRFELSLLSPPAALPDGQTVGTPQTGGHHCPDASVVCGAPRYDESDPHATVNPTALVEVLSPTTADYDRGGTLAHCRTLELWTDLDRV